MVTWQDPETRSYPIRSDGCPIRCRFLWLCLSAERRSDLRGSTRSLISGSSTAATTRYTSIHPFRFFAPTAAVPAPARTFPGRPAPRTRVLVLRSSQLLRSDEEPDPGVDRPTSAATPTATATGSTAHGTTRFTCRADPPAKLFWSFTVYDVAHPLSDRQRPATRRPRLPRRRPRHQRRRLGRPVLRAHAAAGEEANWVQTIPGRHWFSYFRFYGPLQRYFDRSWKLGDITHLNRPRQTDLSVRVCRGRPGTTDQWRPIHSLTRNAEAAAVGVCWLRRRLRS